MHLLVWSSPWHLWWQSCQSLIVPSKAARSATHWYLVGRAFAPALDTTSVASTPTDRRPTLSRRSRSSSMEIHVAHMFRFVLQLMDCYIVCLVCHYFLYNICQQCVRLFFLYITYTQLFYSYSSDQPMFDGDSTANLRTAGFYWSKVSFIAHMPLLTAIDILRLGLRCLG